MDDADPFEVCARAADLYETRSAAASSKDASGVDVALWGTVGALQPPGRAGALPGESLEHSNARQLALHSCLGLIEFHAREAAAECCVTATQQLVEMLRGTLPASTGNNVRAAVVYTGGTTSDAALLMAPLISGLRAESPFIITLSGRSLASAGSAWRVVLNNCLQVDARNRAAAVLAPLGAAGASERVEAADALTKLFYDELVREVTAMTQPAQQQLRQWYAARAALLAAAPPLGGCISIAPPVVIVVENADQCSPAIISGLILGCAEDETSRLGLSSADASTATATSSSSPRFLLVLGSSGSRDTFFTHVLPEGAVRRLDVTSVYLDGALQLLRGLCDRLFAYGALPLRLSRSALSFLRAHAAEYSNGVSWFMHAMHFVVVQHWAEADAPEEPATQASAASTGESAASSRGALPRSPAWVAYLVADIERWATVLEARGSTGEDRHAHVPPAPEGTSIEHSRLWRTVCRVAAWIPQDDVDAIRRMSTAPPADSAHPQLDEGVRGCENPGGAGGSRADAASPAAESAAVAASSRTGPSKARTASAGEASVAGGAAASRAPSDGAARAAAKRAKIAAALRPWYDWKTALAAEDEEIAAHKAALAAPAPGDTSTRLLGVAETHLPLKDTYEPLSAPRRAIAAHLFGLTVHRLGWLTAAAVLMRALGREVWPPTSAREASTHRALTHDVRSLFSETQTNRATSLPVAKAAREAVGRMSAAQLIDFLREALTLLETGVGPAHGAGEDTSCCAAFPPWAAAVHPALVFARHVNAARKLLHARAGSDAAGAGDVVDVSAPLEPLGTTSATSAAATLPAALRGPAQRRQLRELQMQAAKQHTSSAHAAPAAPLAADRSAVVQWLDALFDAWLVPVSERPMHAAVEFGARGTQRLKAVLHAAPRARVLTALAHPRRYIACDCCPERSGDVSAAMPDAALCFAVLSAETSEANRSAPLAVLLSTFTDIIRSSSGGGREDSERSGAQARGRQGAGTKRRRDYASDAPTAASELPSAAVLERSKRGGGRGGGRGGRALGAASGVYAAPVRRGIPAAAPGRVDPAAARESDEDSEAEAGNESVPLPGGDDGAPFSDRDLRVRFTYALAELRLLGLARMGKRRGGTGDLVERCVFDGAW